jgi:hypothetical protein
MMTAAAAAAIVATSAFAVPSAAAAPRTPDVQRVNWGDVTIPGKLCKVTGSITLHNGSAVVTHSGYGPIEVFTTTVKHGNLGHGLQVTTLQIFCSAMSSTAAGQVAEGIYVFDSPGGRAHLLGTLTSQYHPKSSHVPYLAVDKITTGHITTTEYFYASGNPDCCPSGRANTTWTWTGRKFVPGHTTVTG